ncbi:MAG: hypothetical protein JXJ17_03015 [Anaerolineae bacterium]|nr:hypothetical protein [Anaerolineae bacterium]
MLDFIRDVWRFTTGKRDHPIVAHEMEGWSYLRIWRSLRKGCLPLIALLVLGSAGCCGVVTLLSSTSVDEWPLVVGAMFVGLYIGGELVRWLVGLLATALTATVLSAEVEAQTVGLLRLTPIPMREIVLAKYGAAVRQFKVPLIVVALTRFLLITGLLLIIMLAFVVALPDMSSSVSYAAPLFPGLSLTDVLSLVTTSLIPYLIAGILMLLALFLWFLYFLFSPVLEILLFAAVGLLASAWARTRANGLVVGAGLRIGLWSISYVSGQVVSTMFSFFTFPLMALYTAPIGFEEQLARISPAVLATAGALLANGWLLAVVLIRIAVVLVLLFLSTNRASRIPTK